MYIKYPTSFSDKSLSSGRK